MASLAKKRRISPWSRILTNADEVIYVDVLDKVAPYSAFIELPIGSRRTLLVDKLPPDLLDKILNVTVTLVNEVWEPIIETDCKSVFYLIDLMKPVRYETVSPLATLPEFDLHSLPRKLIPTGLLSHDKELFPAGFDSGCYMLEPLYSSTSLSIYVYSWEKSISARCYSSKYYSKISPVKISVQLPTLEDDRFKIVAEMMDKPLYLLPSHLTRYMFTKVKDAFRSRDDKLLDGLLIKMDDVIDGKIECSSGQRLDVYIWPLENQVTQFLADVITSLFPEFVVTREAGSPKHPYTLFFNSRGDITIYRRRDSCQRTEMETESVSAQLHILGDNDEDTLDQLAFEAKNSPVESQRDIFQLLANVEIAATQIAASALERRMQINKIIVYGGLLHYKDNNGIVLKVVMDFGRFPLPVILHSSWIIHGGYTSWDTISLKHATSVTSYVINAKLGYFLEEK